MNDYLSSLIAKRQGTAVIVRPRPRSLFEPAAGEALPDNAVDYQSTANLSPELETDDPSDQETDDAVSPSTQLPLAGTSATANLITAADKPLQSQLPAFAQSPPDAQPPLTRRTITSGAEGNPTAAARTISTHTEPSPVIDQPREATARDTPATSDESSQLATPAAQPPNPTPALPGVTVQRVQQESRAATFITSPASMGQERSGLETAVSSPGPTPAANAGESPAPAFDQRPAAQSSPTLQSVHPTPDMRPPRPQQEIRAATITSTLEPARPDRQPEITASPFPARPLVKAAPTLPGDRQAGAQSSPTPPTIRVTIGRIEVRAITPPPQPASTPPPARPRQPTLSLDAYLKQRNGEQQ